MAKLAPNEVVIVASVMKFTSDVDFNWGYCFATSDSKSEIFNLDTDDFWMAKLRAIDEVINKFEGPHTFHNFRFEAVPDPSWVSAVDCTYKTKRGNIHRS